MKPITLAKSKERESLVEDGVVWWKEYRLVRSVLDDAYQVEQRYMCRVNGENFARLDGHVALFTDPETTWEAWSSKERTQKAAVEDVIGDSAFFEAISLDSLHAAAVESLRADRERSRLRHQAEQRYQGAVERLRDWKYEQSRLFTKRHGHKDGEAFQKAFEKTKKRLQGEHDRLLKDVNEAKTFLEEAKNEADKRLR
jgi:hypothetical protein